MRKLFVVCIIAALALIALAPLPAEAAKLAYVITDGSVVMIHDMSTGKERSIALGKLNVELGSLQFSPDGKHLAFWATDYANPQTKYVYTIDLSQSRPRPHCVYTGSFPCFMNDPGTGKTDIISFDNRHQLFVNNDLGFRYNDDMEAVAAFPDLTRLAILRRTEKPAAKYIILAKLSKTKMPPKSTKTYKLSSQDSFYPCISPDSKSLLYTQAIAGNYEVSHYEPVVIDLTTGKRKVLPLKTDAYVIWESAASIFYTPPQGINPAALKRYTLATKKSTNVIALKSNMIGALAYSK